MQAAKANRNPKFERKELEFIARARRKFEGKLSDEEISSIVAFKKGWAQGAVEYQINRMVREKLLVENPIKSTNKSALPSI